MKRFFPTLLCLLLPLTAACSSRSSMQGTAPESDYRAAIEAASQQMLHAWNRDDLDAHLEPYADSATWMTGTGLLRGRAAIRATLVKSFQRDGDLVGTLSFSDTEYHRLAANVVMTTSTFQLTNLPNDKELKGRATLLWVRSGSKWQIVHDHSS